MRAWAGWTSTDATSACLWVAAAALMTVCCGSCSPDGGERSGYDRYRHHPVLPHPVTLSCTASGPATRSHQRERSGVGDHALSCRSQSCRHPIPSSAEQSNKEAPCAVLIPPTYAQCWQCHPLQSRFQQAKGIVGSPDSPSWFHLPGELSMA